MTVVVLGFVVVERKENSRAQMIDKVVSRRFTVKDAAEQFAALARKDGRDVWVRDVCGSELPPRPPRAGLA